MRRMALVLLGLLLLLVAGCGKIAGTSPESIVIGKLANPQSKADPFTIRVLLTQPIKDHVLVLVEYQLKRTKKDTEMTVCQALYDVFLDAQHDWTADGSSIGCSSVHPLNPRPNGIASGMKTLARTDDIYSYVYGSLANEDVVAVMVTWKDGVNQAAVVNHGVFIAVRDGQASVSQVVERDQHGDVISDEGFAP